jgi:hypothetical protein
MNRTNGFILIVLILFAVSHVFAEQNKIRTFTNRDLERYQDRYSIKKGNDQQETGELERNYFRGPKDPESIFNENSPAVVAVVAFRRDGNVIKHGSGFFVGSEGQVAKDV